MVEPNIHRPLHAAAESGLLKCQHCESTFSQENARWNHVQMAHGDLLRSSGHSDGSPRPHNKPRDETLRKAHSATPTRSGATPMSKHNDMDFSTPLIMSDEPTGLHRLSLDADPGEVFHDLPGKVRSPRRRRSPETTHSGHHTQASRRHAGARHSRKADVRPKALRKQHTEVSPMTTTVHIQDDPASIPYPAANSPATHAPSETLLKSFNRSTLSPSSDHFQTSAASTPMSDIHSSTKPTRAPSVFDPREASDPVLLLQPASRPISQAQLAAEVKSIYAGLVMVENKCISVDKAQAFAPQDKPLADDHWAALIALHRTLLHEHHDFFLASQHPSASPALQRLALKYSMPARMWKHGIHSFLELLRKRLPESLDYMLAFIYLAYQMVALLYETVVAFEDTWIECLGDLGRYRMAIEDEDLRDRDTWSGTSRSWYSKAADKNPTVGRLYHHLAILARPHALQQLYYYSRSLACIQPFPSARESVLTLFDPVLGRVRNNYSQASEVDTQLIKAHGILFSKDDLDRFEPTAKNYLAHLDGHIGRMTAKWKVEGVYVSVINIASLFDYGHSDALLRRLYNAIFQKEVAIATRPPGFGQPEFGGSMTPPADTSAEDIAALPSLETALSAPCPLRHALRIMFSTAKVALQRIGDKNVLPHVHVLLIFLLSLSKVQAQYECTLIMEHVPWEDLSNFLNTLSSSEKMTPGLTFPNQADPGRKPLPEDYLVRGQIWSLRYFPDTWFDCAVDEDERHLDLPSTVNSRIERVLWLGSQLSMHTRWLQYNAESNIWTAEEAASDGQYEMPDPMEIDITFDSKNGSMVPSGEMRSEETPMTPATTKTELPDPLESTFGANSYLDSTPTNRRVMLPNYTRIICETDMLLNNTDVFVMLVGSGEWRVQIPVDVIFDLHSRTQTNETLGLQARQALDSIKTAFVQRKTVDIVDTKGQFVQDPIELIEGLDSSDAMAQEQDMDEVIIGITRRASDLTLVELGDAPVISSAKPAVLVAENRKTRVKARQQGLTSVASSMIRKVLSSQVRKPG